MQYLQLLLLFAVSQTHCDLRLDPTDTADKCLTPNQEKGRCVKPSECMDKADDDDEIDLEQLNVFRMHDCHYLLKCCPLARLIQQPTTAPPVTQAPRVGCGWSNPNLSKIKNAGTNYAKFGEFPWMVALLRKSSLAWVQKDYLGGGSLIHPSVVMTAAHKVNIVTKNELKCRAGEWDTQTLNEDYEHQERNVAKIISHEGLWLKTGLNNIALLFLEQPFDLTGAPHIGIACLGQIRPRDGTSCTSMGWGQEDFNNANKYAVILKKVQLPIYNRVQCQANIRKFRKLRKWDMHDSMMCAGGEEGVDTCLGDGGSPLVCEIDGSKRYAVYGMVAFGVQCGRKDTPGVYTDVAYLYDWVRNTMIGEGLSTDSFEY
ncbi:phenoloxidase-activating factor 2-like isoform X2 [Zerene cesonia]|uniref:phenoloxidase-activating factor 2-like isoform X2 n=1 Tax=Zerene cesonia TaxID=33412 RepID=UPI0018E535D4|nr:phenoloxidase-activating factor 2-like isoform X2 [Zerene cesonia]